MLTPLRSLLESVRQIALVALLAVSTNVASSQSTFQDASYRQIGGIGEQNLVEPVGDVSTTSHLPQFQALPLIDAIRRSLDVTPIVKTLNGDVTVERVTAFDRTIAGTRVGQELSAFDPEVAASYEGGQFDQPPSSFIGPGIETETRFDEGNFNASIRKKWSLGTTAALSYDPSLAYLYFPDSSTGSFNPAHSSPLVSRLKFDNRF